MPTEASLRKRIERVKREIAGLGELRPGTLSEQFNVCGTAGCHCKADPPRKHGPYYQLSYTRSGRSRTEFVRAEDLKVTRRQLKNYQTLRRLLNEWLELSLELAGLARKARPKART